MVSPEADVPLDRPRLAACLMWARGSCELPTAKPRTRSFLPPLRGAFLDHALPGRSPPSKFKAITPGVQATWVGYQPTETQRLQRGATVAGTLVPSEPVTDNFDQFRFLGNDDPFRRSDVPPGLNE